LSYKEHMNTKVSNAEMDVFEALSASGLTRGMVTGVRLKFKAVNPVTGEHESTVPDFWWRGANKLVYLDGPPHLKNHAQIRDEKINGLLEQEGYEYIRFPYTPPLRRKSKEFVEIFATIKKFLGVADK
jgi:very-short-patch-repair endonuclease